MAKVRPTTDIADSADAFVYVGDDGKPMWLCCHCVGAPEHGCRTIGTAWDGAVTHLWSRHSIRRVWVRRFDPSYDNAVQLAIPLVLAHDPSLRRA